jgi:uncharacterized SAM-binding protein YcdF (DUF218 family)
VVSGGGGETESSGRFVGRCEGLAERSIYEDGWRSTYENAQFSQQQLQLVADETCYPVPSARHMARAVETLADIGWSVGTYPSALRPIWEVAAVVERFHLLDESVREVLAKLLLEFAGARLTAEAVLAAGEFEAGRWP